MKRNIIFLLSVILTTPLQAAEPALQPLQLEPGYLIYETSGNHIQLHPPHAGGCIDGIAGLDATLWDSFNGLAYRGVIAECREGSQQLILTDMDPLPRWHMGLMVIKPAIETAYARSEVDPQSRQRLLDKLSGRYDEVYVDDSLPYIMPPSRPLLNIFHSFGPYLQYNIECWGPGSDWDYGYHVVCADAPDAGSYLFDSRNGATVRITAGQLLETNLLFIHGEELIAYGSIQTGKSGGYGAAFAIRFGEGVLQVFQGEEGGS